jgi:hypothetical protein
MIGGEDSDGAGTSGMVEETTRPARGGETGTTRVGMEDSDGADPAGPIEPTSGGSGNGLSSGLQPGGMVPGGGPGAMVGSLGTGGGSNANQATGDAGENNIDEDVK